MATKAQLLDLLTLALSRLDQTRVSNQPSELDKLVTVATLLAQGSEDVPGNGQSSSLAKGEAAAPAPSIDFSALVSNPALLNPDLPLPTRGGSGGGDQGDAEMPPLVLPRGALAGASHLSVQDPVALKTLQTLLSQLQQRQSMEHEQQQQQQPPYQHLQHMPSLGQAAAVAGAQPLPGAMQHLTATANLQYPLLHVAQSASSAANVAPTFLTPLASVGSAGSIPINPYSAHTLGSAFAPNMTLLQPFAQPVHPGAAAFIPAQQFGSDLLVKLEQLQPQQQVKHLPALTPLSASNATLPVHASQLTSPVAAMGQATVANATLQSPVASQAEVTKQESTIVAASYSGDSTSAPLPPSKPLKHRKSAAASAITSSSASQSGSKRRKGKAKRNPSHNVIEARYRLSINDKIKELRKKVAGKNTKIQKSGVLQLTLERLEAIDDENESLKKENANLRNAHESVVTQVHTLHSQLQAQGVAVDASLLEKCRVPEPNLSMPRSSRSGRCLSNVDGARNGHLGMLDGDNEDDSGDDEDADDDDDDDEDDDVGEDGCDDSDGD